MTLAYPTFLRQTPLKEADKEDPLVAGPRYFLKEENLRTPRTDRLRLEVIDQFLDEFTSSSRAQSLYTP